MNSTNTITLSNKELFDILVDYGIIVKPKDKTYMNFTVNLIPDGVRIDINYSNDPTDPILFPDESMEQERIDELDKIYYDAKDNTLYDFKTKTWTGQRDVKI